VLAAPLVGAGVVTDAPLLGEAAASLGAVVVTPVLGAGEVTVAPVLGVAALGAAASGDAAFVVLLLGEVLLGAIVLLGVVLLGVELVFPAAVSAIAPFEVLVVVPVLDFFEVSLGVVCCAAAGIDSAVSRTAASAYRCAMVGLSCEMWGSAANARRTAYESPHRPCTQGEET
jgi:hypothetical protein